MSLSGKGVKGPKEQALPDPAAKGVKGPAVRSVDELSEREARRELAKLVEEEDDFEFVDRRVEYGQEYRGESSEEEDVAEEAARISLIFGDKQYWLFSSPPAVKSENVLFRGRFESAVSQPIIHVLQLLVSALSIDTSSSDVGLYFPTVDLRFPYHFVYTHRLTLRRIIKYHVVLAAESGDNPSIEAILEVNSPGFESKYAHFESLCKNDDESSDDEDAEDKQSEALGIGGGDEFPGLESIMPMREASRSPEANGLIALEFAADAIREQYSEVGEVEQIEPNGVDADLVGDLFEESTAKRKAAARLPPVAPKKQHMM